MGTVSQITGGLTESLGLDFKDIIVKAMEKKIGDGTEE